MSYAVLRVKLPAIKNLKLHTVTGIAGNQMWILQIQTVRIINGQNRARAKAAKAGKSKETAGKRVSK